MTGEEIQSLSFAEYTIEPQRRRLLRGDTQVPLTARAFDLLVFLACNPGRVVTKDEILESVWKDQFVEEANLSVQVSAVRKALGDQATDSRFLVTIPGKGYQFVADVTTVSPERRGPSIAEAIEDISNEPSSEPAAVSRPGPSSYNPVLIIFALALVGLTGFAIYWFVAIRPGPPARSIAVLPFVDQAGEPSSAYLGDGLAESVIFSLSRIPDLRVMSRGSVFGFQNDQSDAKRIGKELNVETVLRGRFQRSGDSIVVSAELVSTHDNSVIWGGQFARRMADIERLQADIAQSISRELKIKLSGADTALLNKQQTASHEAYQHYLVGRYHLSRATDDGFAKGRDSFRQAIELDPNYALAYAGLADAYNLLSGWGSLAPNEGHPLAKSSAIRALELDEELAEAHTALGSVKLFYDADWTGAEASLARSIAINPNLSDAHMMNGYRLMLLGKFSEAKPFLERSIELDPLSIVKIVSYGNVFYFERDWQKAIEIYRRGVDLDPNSGLARWSLGGALLQSGRTDEAIAEYEKAIVLSGDSPDEAASLACAYAAAGRSEDARKIVRELEARSARAYTPPALIASIYAALGERDTAFQFMEQAFRERDSLLVYLKVEPMYDPLRTDPRFGGLLTRIGLE
jgi:DNA-binding winged helix-turn-helix (wHTH) protein/TolB-like protein/Flp pilus assembly protein TadD